jgi:hypothetical protein
VALAGRAAFDHKPGAGFQLPLVHTCDRRISKHAILAEMIACAAADRIGKGQCRPLPAASDLGGEALRTWQAGLVLAHTVSATGSLTLRVAFSTGGRLQNL